MRACAGSAGSGRIQGFIPAVVGARLGWTLLLSTRLVPTPVSGTGTVMLNVVLGLFKNKHFGQTHFLQPGTAPGKGQG